MELEDEYDDLLAEICEPTSPKQLKVEDTISQQPGPSTSKETNTTKAASSTKQPKLEDTISQQPGPSTSNETNTTKPASSTKQPKLEDTIYQQPGPSTSNETNTTKPASSKTHCVLVNQKQRGNPLLKFITSVPWEYDEIVPDYEVGKTICLLFLSLRYHNINPDYINTRLKELGKKYELRVLLLQVDLKEPHIPLKNLTRICLLTDLTLMLAWSPEEAAKIIENYKIFENKPPDKIMEKVENDPHQKIINALTSIKPVNKTDAMTLITTFGSLENIILATESRLAECPGVGATKAKKLYEALHEPFLKGSTIQKKEDKDRDGEFSGDLSLKDIEKLEIDMQSKES